MKHKTYILGLLLVCGFCSISVGAESPNIVLIISDDQAWGDFGFMGHPTIQTPCLDRLASESLVFTRGYVPSSLCRPSLASMITGLYPHQHKITSNDPTWPPGLEGKWQLAGKNAHFLAQRQEMIRYIDKAPCLPRTLGKQGYISMQTGKWWEGNYRRGGFTSGMTHGDPKRGGRHGDLGLEIGRKGMKPIFDFIDQADSRPFFLWYAPFLPHAPHNPPKKYLDRYIDKTDSIYVARYWAMCEWFDDTCGQILNHLDEKGLSENTLVLFVVDNGWIQNPKTRKYAAKSKRSQYDGGVRTPIMLRWPKHIKPQRDDTSLAISIDLAPTILSACGLKPTNDMQGVDLLDREAVTRRKAIFGEVFQHNAVDINDPATSLTYRWCIEGTWKLILPQATNVPDGVVELYDLSADPHETKNLAQAKPEMVTKMRAKIDAWWAAKPNEIEHHSH